MTVPEFMPVLSYGKHMRPAEGACVMEYVSFLAGEQFSDHPKCTNLRLAQFAWAANDMVDDEERQRLLAYVPRLMGTALSREDGVRFNSALSGDDAFREAELAFYGHSGNPIDRLDAALNVYERMFPRTPEPLTANDFRRMAELTGAAR